jgi:phage shock protein PspC (stress-responsive transcriptional regulator)
MNKVITINLNGRAYQLEEQGYAKLQNYLADAAKHLEADPDKDEIVADLEQAVAEKFDRLLSSAKNVVTEKEIEKIIEEMGKVESQEEEKKDEQNDEKKSETRTKRLYRLREGAIIGGVCAGLAAYFNIDVSLIRLIFVLLTIFTGGIWIVVYVVLMFILPQAETSAEMASAFGKPYTAQDFVDRARQEYVRFSDKSERKKWKYEMKQKIREAKMNWRQYRHSRCYQPDYCGGGFYHSPLRGLLIAAVSIFFCLEFISLISGGGFFGHALPIVWPFWIVLCVWIYLFILAIHIIKHHSLIEFLWMIAVWIIAGWAVWHFAPVTRPYFMMAGQWFDNFKVK